MSARVPSVVLAVLAAFLASCSTFYDARFGPAPLEMALEDSATPELSGRALISVVGVRRADRHARTPAQFEVILRLENIGSLPFSVDPTAFELVTADLQSIRGAHMRPETPPTIEQGGSAQLEVAFPLPEGRSIGEYDISGLNLRWTLTFADRHMVMGASFRRDYQRCWGGYPGPYYGPYYYDPFWGPRWHIGVGVRVGKVCVY